MLDQIPTEVLSQIAYHLALPTLSPPVPLLQTCSEVHEALTPINNPRLYARLFRSAFDHAAAARRGADETVQAINLTRELEQRIRLLRRLRRRVIGNNARAMTTAEAWMVYVMLIENDGQNIKHLHFLPELLDLFHAQILHPWSFSRGYPPESTLSSLMLWIDWIYSHHPQPSLTDITSYQTDMSPAEIQLASEREWQRTYQRDYPLEAQSMKRTALRPYVFAAHKYSVYYAPWMATQVPIRHPLVSMTPPSFEVHHAAFRSPDRGEEVEWYGQTIRISPPMLAHAALFKFFDGRKAGYDDSDDEDEDDSDEDEDDRESSEEGSQGEEGDEESKVKQPKVHSILQSTSHDRDFRRLIACADPHSSPGLPRGSWRGVFQGAWEGTFCFFEFDAYGEMLAGNAGAIYSGPYGVQKQVWKLRETLVRRKLKPVESAETEVAPDPTEDDHNMEQEVVGDCEDSQDQADEDDFPLHGPSTNANFPVGPSTLTGGLASARAEEMALQETIKQQVEAMGEEYEVVPDDEAEDMESRADEVGLEMLLTGTGHSAWGRFLLKGRVRHWDGLATLVKEYAPDSRGKWLYRGYVVAGSSMVGRWRDTYTADQYVGYEGSYTLNRR